MREFVDEHRPPTVAAQQLLQTLGPKQHTAEQTPNNGRRQIGKDPDDWRAHAEPSR